MKNKKINIIASIINGNDKILNKIYIINKDTKVPQVPGANLIYPTKKIDTKNLVRFFICNLYY